MPDTGLSSSPKLVKGSLVQIVPILTGVAPKVVAFQYNPEKLSHSLTPWNPFEVDQAQRGSHGPTIQPYDPKESFTLSVELDAADGLEDDNAVTKEVGIADRLAAFQMLLKPTDGAIGDLVGQAANLLNSATASASRPTVPVVFFVWGPGRILPVRITSYSVEETHFSPTLYPIRATVSLGLEVLTPDVFQCQGDPASELAISAYEYTRKKEDSLAQGSVSTNVDSIRGILPF